MRALSMAIAALVLGLSATSWFVFHDRGHSARSKAPSSYVGDVNPAVASLPLTQVLAPAEQTAKHRSAVPEGAAKATAPSETSAQEAPYLDLFSADAPAVAESWKYQNAVRAELAKLSNSGVTVEAFVCRLRLCKARLLFDSVQSDMKTLKDVFLTGITQDFPRGFGAIAAPTRDYLPTGQVRATIYLAREGDMVVASDDSEAMAEP